MKLVSTKNAEVMLEFETWVVMSVPDNKFLFDVFQKKDQNKPRIYAVVNNILKSDADRICSAHNRHITKLITLLQGSQTHRL